MDKKRIELGILLAAFVVSVVAFVPCGNPAGLLLLLAVCALAMNEFYDLLALGNMPASRRVGMVSGMLFVAMTWLCYRQDIPKTALWSLLLLILLTNFFRLFAYNDARRAFQNALGTLFGFIYVAFFWSFFVRICMTGPLEKPAQTGLYLLLAVKWGDAGAYFIGSRFGKHRLLPRISPKKSWEGLLGAILFSCVVGVLWWKLSGAKLGPLDFPFYHAMILSVLLPVVGTMGDLVESLFKRAVNVKDSGALAHGMGGMLDMIDSLLFTAPFMYMYIEFFLTP
jgi:phosphatidate cytidylyltransferase